MRKTKLSSALASALALTLLTFGCSDDETSVDESAPAIDFAFKEAFGSGPVRLFLRLEKTKIQLSDRVVLEQELVVEPGFLAEFPEYLAEDFEGFSVVEIDYLDETPPVVGNEIDDKTRAIAARKQRYRKRLTLEPNRSGDLAIAPLAVYFLEVDGKKKELHFFTDEVAISVARVENFSDLSIHDDRDILEAPPLVIEDRRLLWTATGLGAMGIIVGAYLLLRRRERYVPPPPPAHVIAYEALRRLVAQKLLENGEIEAFFVHLSAIVRQYIENRFAVHAPGRTTEEFLREASRSKVLARHRERLGEFLGLSDQVKFARFEPESSVIQGSFDVVKQFIEETKSDDA
jgi:hypothetical protein